MTRLWQKYALALFLAALLPLGLGAWRLASRGTQEVTENAMRFHLAVGDAALTGVKSWLDMAMLELRTVAATIAAVSMPPEERENTAQAQLLAAKTLDLLVIYSTEGVDVRHMVGGNAEAKAVSKVEVPKPLPEVERQRALDVGFAIGRPTRVGDSFLLPVTVPIRKSDGTLYAYAWTALDMSPLSDQLTEQSAFRFGAENQIMLLDRHEGKDRVLAPSKLLDQELFSGPSPLEDVDFTRPRSTRTFGFTSAAGDEMYGAALAVSDLGLVVLAVESREAVFAAIGRIWSTALLIGGIFAAIALLVGVLGGKRLSAPITGVSSAASKVAAGDFSVRVPVRGKDEVAELGRSFNSMTSQLTDTIRKLQETTAAKERMQTELAIGHNIQMSMVPLDFPAYPDRPEFDIHAALKPAYEVGGDFYDFFLIDEDTLCVCIADVSGKGVPAALFMAVTRTLVKAHASSGHGPDEILEKVNDDLARDNEESMFVTVFLGLLDLKTGVLTFTNAGHNPSYIKTSSGAAKRLDQLHGPVVAAIEEVPYASGTATMQPGDTLILYTDGVNEAMNIKQELFTEERLAKLLETSPWDSSKKAVDVILDDVWGFQGDADQADDVTVVALRYLGKKAA